MIETRTFQNDATKRRLVRLNRQFQDLYPQAAGPNSLVNKLGAPPLRRKALGNPELPTKTPEEVAETH